MTGRLCQIKGLEGKGKIVNEGLKKIHSRIFLRNRFDEKDDLIAIINQMLRNRKILELEVFQKLVDACLPTIPKVEISGEVSGENKYTKEVIGELDALVLLDKYRYKFIGLEVTLRSDLEKK